MNSIQPNAHVVLDYVLRDDDGHLLDASDAKDGEPITYIHGYGMIVPGLEAAIVGMKAGDAKEIVVKAEEGFGDRDEELVLEVDRGDFPEPDKVEIGDELIAESPDGDEVMLRVLEVKSESVIVDANHPLAGMQLHYSVKVREVRAATEAEITEAALEFEEAAEGHHHCDDPTHDHGPKQPGENLVQLNGKKNGGESLRK